MFCRLALFSVFLTLLGWPWPSCRAQGRSDASPAIPPASPSISGTPDRAAEPSPSATPDPQSSASGFFNIASGARSEANYTYFSEGPNNGKTQVSSLLGSSSADSTSGIALALPLAQPSRSLQPTSTPTTTNTSCPSASRSSGSVCSNGVHKEAMKSRCGISLNLRQAGTSRWFRLLAP